MDQPKEPALRKTIQGVSVNPDQTPAPTPRRSNRRATIAIGVVLLGILALIYPVVSTHYNNYKQREFALKYGNNVQNIDTSEREAALEAAREYNKRLPGVPILDPWLTEVANPASPAYDEYRQQLSNAGDIIARLRVPSASIDLPIRHDTQPEIIDNGVGHLYGTSLPVGGENTHSVLTTHTGLSTATLFDNLDKVKEGDFVYVDVLGHTLAYRVDQIKIVLPNEIGDLSSEPGRDLLTLFTCTPYAVNTHRLLVRAERVPMEESHLTQEADDSSTFAMQAWMWWLLGGAGIATGIFAAMVIHQKRNKADDDAQATLTGPKHRATKRIE
ncbi:class C sortase [Trueperella pyogenes]